MSVFYSVPILCTASCFFFKVSSVLLLLLLLRAISVEVGIH
jgi:hypothetical protein